MLTLSFVVYAFFGFLFTLLGVALYLGVFLVFRFLFFLPFISFQLLYTIFTLQLVFGFKIDVNRGDYHFIVVKFLCNENSLEVLNEQGKSLRAHSERYSRCRRIRSLIQIPPFWPSFSSHIRRVEFRNNLSKMLPLFPNSPI